MIKLGKNWYITWPINKLKEIAKTPDSNGKIIVYLRKINPFVFEELILSVIEDSNIRVYRNRRYTGDGGVDGMIKIKEVQEHLKKKKLEENKNS